MFKKHAATEATTQELKGQLDTVAVGGNRFDYNAVSTELNSYALGDVLEFPYKKDSSPNLVAQLGKRGLERDVDYRLTITKVGDDPTEIAFIEKLSAKEGTRIAVARPGRKAKAVAVEGQPADGTPTGGVAATPAQVAADAGTGTAAPAGTARGRRTAG